MYSPFPPRLENRVTAPLISLLQQLHSLKSASGRFFQNCKWFLQFFNPLIEWFNICPSRHGKGTQPHVFGIYPSCACLLQHGVFISVLSVLHATSQQVLRTACLPRPQAPLSAKALSPCDKGMWLSLPSWKSRPCIQIKQQLIASAPRPFQC